MRKNATKIAAMMLSLALTVTSVNIPTTSSAAAKVKLNSTKATLYVGGSSAKKTKTLKATFNGKKVKATFTSSNSKVAKVAKKTGKVTAVKKGSATITAKYKGKKATAKITVKQYVTGVTTSQDVVELKEGEHINLSKLITVSPASANNKALSYKSDDSLVAAVNGTGTVLKGVKEGTTSIKVTAKDGSKQYTNVRVNVTKGSTTPSETNTPSSGKEAKNAEISLENPFSADYKDTVLVGTNAQLKVRLTDEDGKPVANTEVVLAAKSLDALNTAYTYAFRNLSDSAKRTDADGYVTFVYGLGITHDQYNKPIDATRTEYVSSYKLTASAKNGVQASVDVKFGALDADSITNVDVLNNNVDKKGYTAEAPTQDDGGMAFSKTTASRLGTGTSVEYVSSQTVSSVDGSHKVGITSGVPQLILPGAKTTEASDIKEVVSFDTGKYSTYTTAHWAKVIDSVKASRLQYATVNFGKLSLSKYTRFAVQAYIVTDPANPTVGATAIDLNGNQSGSAYIVSGQKVSGDFAVQIPIDEKADGYLYVTAQVQSKGQVNTDVNEGFTVKNVLGVHRKGAIGREGVALKDVTVQWAKDEEATYTLEQQLTGTSIVKQTLDTKYAGDNKAYTYWYRVPAFPRTGNAIIRVLDSQNKVVDYYAIPTINKANANATAYPTGYENVNIIDESANLHRISEKEATNLNAGTVVSTEAGFAEVDSNDSGITHVVGTLTSTNPEIVIDPTNSKVYSSVHWNPVPVAAAVETHARGAAIVGQQIVLKAQLADKNGNPVAVRNQPVKFFYDGLEITKAMNTVGGAALIKVDEVTNELGQAELVLTSAKKEAVARISTQTGTTGSGYQLGYVLGGKTVTAPHVDLYWLDANLYFEPDANTTESVSTSTGQPAVVTSSQINVRPTVNEHWAYEVRTSGDIKPACDMLNYTTVEITGLNIGTTVGIGSKGTVTDNANGKANVTSTVAGKTQLVNVLNRSSIGSDMTFTAKSVNAWEPAITLDYVGTGTPTLDKKLTLDVDWTAGVPTADFIVPTSDKADINEAKTNGVKVFVQVHDANGNVLKDKEVTMKVTGDKGLVNGQASAKVTTTPLGIAEFTVTAKSDADAGDAATLVVEAADIAGVFSYNLKFIDVSAIDNSSQGTFKVAGDVGDVGYTVFNSTDKTIKLTFTNYVYAPSVIKEQFTVGYGNDTDGYVPQTITDIEVANNTITLKIPGLTKFDNANIFKIDIAPTAVTKTVTDGVEYRLVSADAQFVDSTALTVKFDTAGKRQ